MQSRYCGSTGLVVLGCMSFTIVSVFCHPDVATNSGILNRRVRFHAHRDSVFLGCISPDDLGPHRCCRQCHSRLCSSLRDPAAPLLLALQSVFPP